MNTGDDENFVFPATNELSMQIFQKDPWRRKQASCSSAGNSLGFAVDRMTGGWSSGLGELRFRQSWLHREHGLCASVSSLFGNSSATRSSLSRTAVGSSLESYPTCQKATKRKPLRQGEGRLLGMAAGKKTEHSQYGGHQACWRVGSQDCPHSVVGSMVWAAPRRMPGGRYPLTWITVSSPGRDCAAESPVPGSLEAELIVARAQDARESRGSAARRVSSWDPGQARLSSVPRPHTCAA